MTFPHRCTLPSCPVDVAALPEGWTVDDDNPSQDQTVTFKCNDTLVSDIGMSRDQENALATDWIGKLFEKLQILPSIAIANQLSEIPIPKGDFWGLCSGKTFEEKCDDGVINLPNPFPKCRCGISWLIMRVSNGTKKHKVPLILCMKATKNFYSTASGINTQPCS